ncbi:Phage terminase-like protein%2C large subunit [Achromobacter xylosoxidans]|jgi:hypothetical protein|nr:Phage terminase-like protein%2C large subunit [Achromobacter xylosoxidans]
MAAPQYPRVAQALKFAKDVVKGKVPACRYVVLACQRHLDDLAASKEAKYPYRFNAAQAGKSSRLSS